MRLGVDPHPVEGDELTGKRRHVVAPERPHRRDVLSEATPASLERHPERVVLLLRPADTHAQGQPATRHPVQRRGLFGHDHRIVFRQQQHARRKLDAVGGRRGEAQCDQRVQPVDVGGDRDAAVVAVGVVRIRFVHHDDVLAHPQCRETATLGGRGHGIDHGALRTRGDAESVEAESDHSAIMAGLTNTPSDERVAVRQQ